MAYSFQQLPGYEMPRNALLDLAPINSAIDQKVTLDQQAMRNKFQDRQIGLQERQVSRAEKNDDADRMGKRAIAIAQLPPGHGRATAWQQTLAQHPNRESLTPEYLDPVRGPEMVAAEYGQYIDKQGQALTAAKIAESQASTNLRNKQLETAGQPEIVRQIIAAGEGDPRTGQLSPRGQEMLRNSIKGGSPVDQAVANAIQGNIGPQQPAPSQPTPRLQPQSFEGGTDPNLIRTGAGDAEPQAGGAQQADDPIVQTPLGRMPQSKAKGLAFGLAYQGKGEAGKMMVPGSETFGQAGQNELDKDLIAKVTDVSDLQSIKSQFKPEFLSLEGRIKTGALGWKDYLTGKLSPKEQAYLTDYQRMATTTTERLNNRIKAMSGSAVSAAEEKRMYDANPTVNDGPNTFAAKLNTQIEIQRMAIARYNWLKTKATPDQIGKLAQSGRIEALQSLDGMKQKINDTLDQRAQQLRQQMPNIDENTLRQQLQSFRSQVFGI